MRATSGWSFNGLSGIGQTSERGGGRCDGMDGVG